MKAKFRRSEQWALMDLTFESTVKIETKHLSKQMKLTQERLEKLMKVQVYLREARGSSFCIVNATQFILSSLATRSFM